MNVPNAFCISFLQNTQHTRRNRKAYVCEAKRFTVKWSHRERIFDYFGLIKRKTVKIKLLRPLKDVDKPALILCRPLPGSSCVFLWRETISFFRRRSNVTRCKRNFTTALQVRDDIGSTHFILSFEQCFLWSVCSLGFINIIFKVIHKQRP